jgi:ubiquinone/menaquinone biosynthesis C-methylase UbiE
MPDPYATIAESGAAVQKRLADVLEMRAAEPQQQSMLRAHLSQLDLTRGARALEVGCGTGAVCRALVRTSSLVVTGIDPSPVFLSRARELGSDLPGLSFSRGDGRALSFRDRSFDLVVFHTTLCHVPDPVAALREAHRVLKPDGWLSVFEGDYTTTSVAIRERDPLQALVEAMVAHFVHDPWLTRRLPSLIPSLGFTLQNLQGHGYVQTAEPSYMLTIVDRGADILSTAGALSGEEASSLRQEARQRAEAGEFFGHILFLGMFARKASSVP